MHSVADQLRQQCRRRLLALSVSERLELAFELGEFDLTAFSERQQLARPEAIRLLRARRRSGRQPSGCMEALDR